MRIWGKNLRAAAKCYGCSSFVIPILYCYIRQLRKSSGIPAFAAEFFGGGAGGEAVVYCSCAGGLENIVERGVEKISESKITLMVKAAGHNRPVTEHAELVTQAVAEHTSVALFGRHIRPIELIAGLKPHVRGKGKAFARLCPRLREAGLKALLYLTVERFKAVFIPQAQHAELI